MKIIGHRGARGLGPENTLPSFKAALAAGVDEVELDVRVTRDGICVLNHDPFLHDASNGKLRSVRIAEQDAAALYQYRPDLTTLEEAIRLVNRQVPILVEVKPKVSTAEVITAIQAFLTEGWRPADFLLASFSQRTLEALHATLPDIEKVVLSRVSGVRARWRAKKVGARRLAFNHHNLWWGFIGAMHKRGYHITAYTLNNTAKAARWQRHGLYGAVTDYPDRFKTKAQ